MPTLRCRFLTGERTSEGLLQGAGRHQANHLPRPGLRSYADMVWCETAKPDLDEGAQVCRGHQGPVPDKILAYNCSPSFNWKKNLDDATIARFQQELSDIGYKYQFITLAGIHNMWFPCTSWPTSTPVARAMKATMSRWCSSRFAAAERATPSWHTSGKWVPSLLRQGDHRHSGRPVVGDRMTGSTEGSVPLIAV